MCTADAWRIAKTTNYGILPRIMAFRRQRMDGLRTALPTNSFTALSGQNDSCATCNSTIQQVHHLLITTLFLPHIRIIDHHTLTRNIGNVVQKQQFSSMSRILSKLLHSFKLFHIISSCKYSLHPFTFHYLYFGGIYLVCSITRNKNKYWKTYLYRLFNRRASAISFTRRLHFLLHWYLFCSL